MDNNESSEQDPPRKMEKVDIIGGIAPEIAQLVFMKLPKEDVRNVWNCCLKWKAILSSDSFWKSKYRKDYFKKFEILDEYQQSEIYRNIFPQFGPWQSRYFYHIVLSTNWEKGNCTRRKFIDSNSIRTSDCNGKLWIAHFVPERDDNSDIYIIDPCTNTRKVIKVLNTVYKHINQIQILGNLLFCNAARDVYYLSAPKDGRILQVWNILTEELIYTEKYEKYDNYYTVYKDTFCKLDSDYKLYYFKSGQCCFIYDSVKSVCLYKNLAVIVPIIDTDPPKIINFSNKKQEIVEINCCNTVRICNVQRSSQYVVFICNRGHFITWDIEKRLKLAFNDFSTINLQNSHWNNFTLSNNRIIFKLPDRFCVKEVSTLQHLFDIPKPSRNTIKIEMNNYYIIVLTKSQQEGSIRLYNIQTGCFVKEFSLQFPESFSSPRFRCSDIAALLGIPCTFYDPSLGKLSDGNCNYECFNFDQPINIAGNI